MDGQDEARPHARGEVPGVAAGSVSAPVAEPGVVGAAGRGTIRERRVPGPVPEHERDVPGDAPAAGPGAEVAAPAEAVIRVGSLSKRFGTNLLFQDVGFEVRRGEVFVILGGSGCGKSTLLKLLIGLHPPSSGTIEILRTDMLAAEGEARREILRHLGVMWQSGALFGSMTLLENVMLPLEAHTRLPRAARETVARVKLGMVGLADAAGRLPAEISGGMAKRAGIARAMALDPPILFLDEPSAGLDPITSAGLDQLIRDLARDLGTTFVVVTHELQSILAIGDRCIMLDKQAKGMIAEGDPRSLRDNPPNSTVRHFFRREAA